MGLYRRLPLVEWDAPVRESTPIDGSVEIGTLAQGANLVPVRNLKELVLPARPQNCGKLKPFEVWRKPQW